MRREVIYVSPFRKSAAKLEKKNTTVAVFTLASSGALQEWAATLTAAVLRTCHPH